MSDQIPAGELEQRIHRHLLEVLNPVPPTTLLDWERIEAALNAELDPDGGQAWASKP